MCRSENYLSNEIKAKISLFCNVEVEAVFTAKDVEHIYDVPLIFHKEGVDERVVNLLNIWTGQPRLGEWEDMVHRLKNPLHEVTIAVVGKYVNLADSYKSLNEALTHGGIANRARVNLLFVDSEKIEKEGVGSKFRDTDGILVPGGFGSRGIEGKIQAIHYARTNRVPYFGICLGMQTAVIEFARNVCQMKKANSSEFDGQTPYPVIDFLPEQRSVTDKGATMRLGSYPCLLGSKSFAFDAYGEREIHERHRHRYELNNQFRDALVKKGLRVTGTSPDGNLVEIVEISDHPWFLGCQFHPEFKSKPMKPHPLFAKFIGASLKAKLKKGKSAKKKKA
jgi:CTP synthase